MAETMINVNGLTKSYPNFTAVSDLSFKVKRGEVIGFLGPNGAGKTTTMRMLTGYTPPTKGAISIAGFDVVEQPQEIRQRIGYLPEHVPLYKEMRVASYLRYNGQLKGVNGNELEHQVRHAIDACGLGEVQQRIISTISRGYRQRVGLAQALLGDPEVIILDEPTVGLDPKQIMEIRHLIKKLGKERTILLSTHILPEVEQICDRVIIINRGKLIATGTTSELQTLIKSNDVVEICIKGKKLDGFDDLVEKHIKSVIGVVVTEQDDDTLRAIVESEGEIRSELVNLILKHHYELLELKKQDVDLEEIFLSLTKE